MSTLQFALISHTNNGKTTLARTLTGADVGEVRDAAHVTIFSEAHTLLTTPQGDALMLWDTPGFGDSVRLLKRLGSSGNPVGWFLREVLDRLRDRSFWLSQQALRAARDAADVVLYLVNSAEDPRDTGYLPAEMKILEWLGKPVVVLLNQMGPPSTAAGAEAERLRWQEHLSRYPAVREVLPMDAFARCWVHEHVLFETIDKLIAAPQAEGYARLLAEWKAHNARRFDASMAVTAEQLAAAAMDSQRVEVARKSTLDAALNIVGLGKNREQARQDGAMQLLVARIDSGIAHSTARLLELHKLDRGNAARINARVLHNFVVRAPIDQAQAGLLGAVLSGAATGVSADLLAGGLTFGAGALLGGVVGALTFAGAAWGFNSSTDRLQPTMYLREGLMNSLLVASVLRYLAVIHFGRGRGNFVESEAPLFWQAEVERAAAAHAAELNDLWLALRGASDRAAACARVRVILSEIVALTLTALYPGSVDSIRAAGAAREGA